MTTVGSYPYFLSEDKRNWCCGIEGCTWSRPVEKRSLIVYHKNTHFPKYTCEQCKESFPQKLRLEVHIRTYHTGETPYKCDECDKAFIQLSNLKDHVRKVHMVAAAPAPVAAAPLPQPIAA